MINPVIREDAARIGKAVGADIRALEGKTVLVTGAAGFLCAYFADVLATLNDTVLARPARLILVDNFLRGVPDRLAHLDGRADVRIETADVVQTFDPGEPVHHFVHGASIASPTYYRRYPLETIDVNVIGLRNLLETSRSHPVESVIVLSSSEVYGDPEPDQVPTPETYWGRVSFTGPRACYDESKRLGETISLAHFQTYGTRVRMIRPFNVYGPGQRLDDGRIVPDLLSSVLAKQNIVLFSDGTATRSFCYAGDFTLGMLLVMLRGRDGEPYNLGNDTEMSVRELAEVAAGLVEPALAIETRRSSDSAYLTDNPNRRCPDLTKVRALGYAPAVGVHAGLARTLRAYTDGDAAPDGPASSHERG